MPFTVEVIRGATTYNISDGNPFRVETADLLGGASVRNIEESGPFQDGSTHLTERLDPRTLTLKINVIGASASALDGHRDTLNKMFKPVVGVPIILKLTRDDGVVRQLDTRRTGPLDIPLRPENKPGNLHRAVVQLRAADPTYYNPTQQSESFLPPSGAWQLGYLTIGTANVLEYVESPGTAQLWTNSGSVAAGSPFTVAFRSGSVALPGVGEIRNAFSVYSGAESRFGAFTNSGNIGYSYDSGTVGNFILDPSLMPGSANNYFFVNRGSAVDFYRGTTLISSTSGASNAGIPTSAAGSARWRSRYDNFANSQWLEELPYAAAYNIALDSNQRFNLDGAMNGTANFGTAYSVDVVYAGDVDSYPIFTIAGPVNDPVITNTTTGDILDFTGGTVGSADTWTVDLRYGRKSATNAAGSSVANFLSDASDLSTFRLVADPLATGGTNTITVASSDAGTAGLVTLSYYERYLSF